MLLLDDVVRIYIWLYVTLWVWAIVGTVVSAILFYLWRKADGLRAVSKAIGELRLLEQDAIKFEVRELEATARKIRYKLTGK